MRRSLADAHKSARSARQTGPEPSGRSPGAWRWFHRALTSFPGWLSGDASRWRGDVPVRDERWLERVNEPLAAGDLHRLSLSGQRGRPYGDESWTKVIAMRLGLGSPLGSPGTPRKQEESIRSVPFSGPCHLESPVDCHFLVVVSRFPGRGCGRRVLDLGRFPRGVLVMQGHAAPPGKPSSAPGSKAPPYGSQINISSWPPGWNTRMPTWLTRITRPSRLACE